MTFYNRDNNAAYESATAGTQRTVSMHWCSATEDIFGNPYIKDDPTMGSLDSGAHRTTYPNKFCMVLNTTTHDTPVSVKAELPSGSIVEMNRVSVPVNVPSSSGHAAYCYEAPVIDDDCVDFLFKYDADDSSAPSDDDTAYLFAGGYYLNDDGEVAWGVETDQGGYVGSSAYDSGTLDFTA